MTNATRRSPLGQALRACFPALIATFVLSLFINASMLASPLYSMQVYDRVLTSRNVGTLVMLTLIVGIFLALYGILEFARSGVLARAGVLFEGTLRHPLFETMMKAELSPRHRFGQQVIRDAETIRDCLSSGTAAVVCDLPWTPIYVALCFMQHAYLGILAVFGSVLLFSLALFTEFYTHSSVDRTNALANEASRIVAAALRNGEVIRGLGMGDIVLDRWSNRQSAMVQAHSTLVERGAAMHAVTKFARLAVQTSLLCIGAWLAIDRQISPGAMMAASIIMGRALAPVEQIVGQWKRIIAFRSAYRRLEDLFQALPLSAAPTALPTPRGDIVVENAVVWPTGREPSLGQGRQLLDAGRRKPGDRRCLGQRQVVPGARDGRRLAAARRRDPDRWCRLQPVGPDPARQAYRLPAAGHRAVLRHGGREHRPPRQGRG